MTKKFRRDKHKQSHSRYARYKVEESKIIKEEKLEENVVVESKNPFTKVKSFLRSEKEKHDQEIKEKNKLVDQAIKMKRDASFDLDSEKYKLNQLKEQTKEQSQKVKEEKKNYAREKKNLKHAKKKN